MRLDKYLASVTPLSRKNAKQQVRAATVCIDGIVATNPSSQVKPCQQVTLAGKPLRPIGFRYYMLHKPAGIICATQDAHHVTAIDLIHEDNGHHLQIAGRLDKDTTGLVLLTDDGQWNHRLTSPRHDCSKTYELSTLRPIDDDVAPRFAEGIVLPPDTQLTRPAQLTRHDHHHARLVLSEGRYHQVKRMFEATGNRVLTLHRSAIGRIKLDDTLAPGRYRALTTQEVDSINQ